MIRFLVFIGIVGALVGGAGLLAPVSVDPEREVVNCGTTVSPDLSEARAHDDGNAANVPLNEGILIDTDYTELCRMELEDRRLWALTLAGAGLLLAIAVVTYGAVAQRRGHRGRQVNRKPTTPGR
jgi:hypothetical protein